MKSLIVASAILVSVHCAYGEEHQRSVVFTPAVGQPQLTGNLHIDLFAQKEIGVLPSQHDRSNDVADGSRKSPWLAAGLSVVLPGAGEFYAESYWKAALFLALDVAAWSFAYHFDKKGDRQTDFFQNYANQSWDPQKYAQYSFDHYLTSAQQDNFRNRLFKSGSTPWERVNWVVLNEMERLISSTAEGKFYSHTLPPFGDQQYYELIGKYQQFYQGWNDADPTFTTYDLIAAKINNDYTNFKYYAGERGRANDFYNTAGTFVTVAVVNHVLSAIDAAWTASSYNKNIHASVRMQSVPTEFGYVRVPVARVEYSF